MVKAMQEKNKLTLWMGLLYLIVILSIGLIIISEKKKDYLIPKIKEKLVSYLEKEYKEEIQNLTYGKVLLTENSYQMKVYHSQNKNLYFIVTWKNKEITDTYQIDYLEGKTLNTHLSKKMTEKIPNSIKEKYQTYTISFDTKLNNCTKEVKEKLIKEEILPIYTINVETDIHNTLQEEIQEILKDTESLNLHPKNFHITLNNSKSISKSIHLEVEHDIIKEHLEEIINSINHNDSTTLDSYHVKWKYLN